DINAKNLKVIGGLRNNGNNIKARLENYEIALFGDFSYGENVISFLDQRSLIQAIPTSSGLFGAVSTHRGDRDRPNSGTYQLFRDYSGRFHRNTNENIYTIWNKPELSESGAKSKAYNNDPNFIYANNLTTITTGLADHG